MPKLFERWSTPADQLRADLVKLFPALGGAAEGSTAWKFRETAVLIAQLLEDRDRSMAHRLGLEQALAKKLDGVDLDRTDQFDLSLVLRSVLRDHERTFGFNRGEDDTDRIPPLLGGVIDGKAFFDELLSQGRQWIDPGAGYPHGDSTHRLQWYLITEAWGVEGKQSWPLTPVQFFKAIPGVGYAAGWPPKSETELGRTAWDFVTDAVIPLGLDDRPDDAAEPVEGLPEALTATTFRSPEALYAWLRERTGAVPILTKILTKVFAAHREKRELFAWEQITRYGVDFGGVVNPKSEPVPVLVRAT